MKEKNKKRKLSWWCSDCKTEYNNKKDAKKCSKMPRLWPEFKVGDKVSLVCPMFCEEIADALDAFYVGRGMVVGVIGTYRPDKEYIQEYLVIHSHLARMHYYLYLVTHKCPYCKRMESYLWHGPELKKQSPKSKSGR